MIRYCLSYCNFNEQNNTWFSKPELSSYLATKTMHRTLPIQKRRIISLHCSTSRSLLHAEGKRRDCGAPRPHKRAQSVNYAHDPVSQPGMVLLPDPQTTPVGDIAKSAILSKCGLVDIRGSLTSDDPLSKSSLTC